MTGTAIIVAEPEKSFGGCTKTVLHLFDEEWFFYNALTGRSIPPSPGGMNDGESATSKVYVQEEPAGEAVAKKEKAGSPTTRRLLRTPSLPPPRADHEGTGGIEEERGSGGRKVLHSYSSLDSQQSVHCSSKSMGKQRPPRTEISNRRCANPHVIKCWEARFRKAFLNKKWRSLGDLETMELQGFKDLGFVFDDLQGLSSRLFRVIPSGGERKEKEGDGRIYLSEAWFTQRSAPPMVLSPVGCGTAEEMKENLRFWARAVACRVRGKCC